MNVYDINFWLFSVDLNWHFILIYKCTFSDVLALAEGKDRQRC